MIIHCHAERLDFNCEILDLIIRIKISVFNECVDHFIDVVDIYRTNDRHDDGCDHADHGHDDGDGFDGDGQDFQSGFHSVYLLSTLKMKYPEDLFFLLTSLI